MKALLCKVYGDPQQFAYEEIPSPVLEPGMVRIAVQAIGMNGADALQVLGQFQPTRHWREHSSARSSGSVSLQEEACSA